MNAFFPMFVRSTHASVIVIGGGEVARAKIEALKAAGVSNILVFAALFTQECRDACREAGADYHETPYYSALFDEYRPQFAIVATNDPTLNADISADARARHVLVNVVDDPENSDFIMPAVVRRDAVTVAISTGGISPVLARHVKQRIENVLPDTLSAVAGTLAQYRDQIRVKFPEIQSRRVMVEHLLNEGWDTFPERLMKTLEQPASSHKGQFPSQLYLISAGPGDPQLLTLAAIEALSIADVVLYDQLIPYEALERYARRDGLKIDVGKRCGNHTMQQHQINALIEEYLKAGKIVARLKGGDAGIYARTTEEIAVADKVGAPYRIIPGISAALGCAAALGVPLTDRTEARVVRFLTVGKADLDAEETHRFWQALRYGKQETFIFYMSGRYRAPLAKRLLALGFDTKLPVAIVTQGTCPQQQVEHLYLEELVHEAPVAPGATLIMMGATFKKNLADRGVQAETLLLKEKIYA